MISFLTVTFFFLVTLPSLSFGAYSPEGFLQFSGALQWAHKKGVTGGTKSVVIIEYPYNILQNTPHYLKERIHLLSSSLEAPPFFIGDHTSHVLSVLNQIVPHSHFIFLSPEDLSQLLL